VSICTIPNSAGSRQRIVKIHTHARFLRALTHEDIDSSRLLDLSRASEKFVTMRVGGFDADNNVTIVHGNMPELNDQLITRKDHANTGYMISENTVGMALSSDIPDITTNCSTGPHSINYCGHPILEML